MPHAITLRDLGVLLAIWGLATLIDLDKPFHVDDPFHVEMAQWVQEHPGHPLSGTINWGGGRVPMHHGNQPPGFFYVLAAVGSVFGYTERTMHLARALFSLIAIVCFHRLARSRKAGHPWQLTALFAWGPAFLVNQGVMIDVPLVALHLLFFDLVLIPRSRPVLQHAMAGAVLAIAFFFKYSTLPLLLLYPLILLIRQERRDLWAAAIPVVTIGLWCVWNLNEFGAVHLLQRGSAEQAPLLERGVAWLTTSGAIAAFVPAVLCGSFGILRERATAICIVLLLSCCTFSYAVYREVIPMDTSDSILLVLFTTNGSLLLLVPWYALRRAHDRTDLSLILWTGAMVFFPLLFAPFMATRHILLALPPFLLLAAPAFDRLSRSARMMTLVSTAGLGCALSFSDRIYAEYYRDQARDLASELKGRGRMWSVGHWGWHWYSEQEGMLVYPDDPDAGFGPAPGDLVLIATATHKQELDPDLRTEPLVDRYQFPRLGDFFHTGRHASLFTSNFGQLPWRLNTAPGNRITVRRITAVGPDAER